MGQFAFLIGHLADVVQETGTLCLLGIQAEFGSHYGAKVGGFSGVLQEVLTVGRAIFHLTDNANQFGVQAVHAEVDGRALTRLDDFFFHLFLHLGHDFLDACGVDAAVGDELVQGEAADFAAYGVESGDNDGLGRVVHNDFNARGGFEGTDIAAFAADDAAFHLVVVDVEHGDAVFNGRFCSHALNSLYDNALGLLACGELRVVHNLVDVALGVGARFVFERFYEAVLGLFGRQATEFFEFLALFELELFEFFLALGECLLLVFHAGVGSVEFLLAAGEVFLLLVEADFALLEFVFSLLELLLACADFVFEFCLLVEELFLHFEQFALFDDFGFFACALKHKVVLLCQDVAEYGKSDAAAYE